MMKYTKEELCLIWLDSFVGLEYKHKVQIYECLIKNQKISDGLMLAKDYIVKSVGENEFSTMLSSAKQSYLDYVLDELGRREIVAITIKSKDYPHKLNDIELKPLVLYAKGNLKLLQTKTFAIVGSRKSLPLSISIAKDYASTWETIKSKLFDSSLGGYLCFRYEEDGNYIDYLSDFELTNTQPVKFGENLLDLKTESDASTTYSAVIPLGKKRKEIDENTDDESRLTIDSLSNGDVTEDIYIKGDMLISRSAKEAYGIVIAPPKDTTWDDITKADNLRDVGVEYLTTTASKMSNTITVTAIDLHCTDEEIAGFRIYRYIHFESSPHGFKDRYKLTQLDIDILNPQNTKITFGDTKLSMTDINKGKTQSIEETVEIIKKQASEQGVDLSEVQNIVVSQSSSMVTTCEEIILSAMTDYVETGNFTSFKETVESQLKILSDEISLNFTSVTDQIENVNGDLQEKFNTITKYFTFDIDGLTIGQTDNPYKVVIDNDRYSMLVNGVEVLWFDAEGKAHIPEVEVTRKMKMFGYLIEEDESGNVNCEYVGGDA